MHYFYTWHVPSKAMGEIKLLSREYRDLEEKTTPTKNQLHAKRAGHQCSPSIEKRLKKQIRMLKNQTGSGGGAAGIGHERQCPGRSGGASGDHSGR